MAFPKTNITLLLLSLAFAGMMYLPLSQLSPTYALFAFTYLVLFHYSIFAIALRIKKIAIIVIPVLLFLSTVGAYLYNFLNIKISDNLLFLLIETTVGEASETLTPQFVLSIVIALLLSISAYAAIKRCTQPPKLKWPILLLLLLIPINVALSKCNKHPIAVQLRPSIATKYAFPFCVIDSVANFSIRWVQYKTRPKPKSSASLDSELITPQQTEPLTVIFVIGESARADHFQINGYSRETTPHLIKEKNVITYGAIRSFAALTRISVPAMLTPATSAHPKITTNSFLDLFVKHGFATAWISANSRAVYSSDMPTTRIMGNAQQTIFRNDFTTADYSTFRDEMMLPVVKRVLSNIDGNRTIVIHTRGSHFNYHTKYSEKYRKFTPDKYSNYENLNTVINAYDNSILATDAFLANLYDLVRDKNALVIYSSDHGESLGEDGIFMHGNKKRPEQRNVPLIIWYSDKYAIHNPRYVEALKQQIGKSLSHDILFPWTINLGGIALKNTSLPVLMN
ncbi:phosphoethanolamine transferase [Halodesulfovibrio marinisediminis]|uniref:Phosphoethanolamine transferase for glucans (OPG), alkaline phosphatase superfamily n=1 Tax=Halodesulfovibrio marinisediminis DSM 17456 TaxID=1121457 RepID=A0A1N6IBF1_9BACT|nr:phosphoethanolamine transferase [Halodesulfovibrio marinisediminis]SIO29333.1 Phosphoethanolamine transferase for glucans (OPG), alkaline phosphatase superfamily [Halodesulfovibrio marinisediminis DSM 17456]